MAIVKPAKWNVLGLTLAAGITWGASMVIAGWGAIFGWCNAFVEVMASIYIGYEPTFIGGVIGGIWGFADGALAGFLIALFYNLFRK